VLCGKQNVSTYEHSLLPTDCLYQRCRCPCSRSVDYTDARTTCVRCILHFARSSHYKYREHRYKNQPMKIEDYEPGIHSSIAQNQAKTVSTYTSQWRRLNRARGHVPSPPHFYKWLGTGGTVSRRTANKKLAKLY